MAVSGYELLQGGDFTVTETQTWAEGTAALKPKCGWCGNVVGHDGICYRVKTIEYRPDGTIKRVEFR